MRTIKAEVISETIAKLFSDSVRVLPDDVKAAIINAEKNESKPMAKKALKMICDNMEIACKTGIPLCQDTGMAVVFADIGREVYIDGNFENAINDGVKKAYRDGFLRCSIVLDPLYSRKNTNDNTPAIIHTRIVEGNKILFTVAPKGFGSENMSKIKMFNPSANEKDIIDFVVETVKEAGGKPCPPLFIGIGIGANFEGVALLAKRALLKAVDDENENLQYANLERKILSAVNESGIGAQGFGGNITALSVKIEQAPTHIAALPVAINIQCHMARHKREII